MARLPYVDRDSLPEEMRAGIRSTSNVTRMMSNSPWVAHHSGTVAAYIQSSRLDPRLRELALIQVGYAVPCPYEYARHVEIGLARGVTDADLRALAEESAGRPSGIDPLAGLVLRAARELTHGVSTSEATFAGLRRHFDNELLMDLIFAIANYVGVCRVLETFQVELEPVTQTFLDRYPIRKG